MRKRKIVFLCIFSVLAFLINYTQIFALNTEKSWFCIRNGNSQPPITKEELMINQYGAVSIDRSVNDTSERKVLYLTFDCGYENGNVKRIVDTLKEENVTAAFFLLDNIILKNTDLVTRMADEGHLICNHTKNHKNLCNESFENIKNDIFALEKVYEDSTGRAMEKIFRFPEGKYSESALKCVNELGYKTFFWSFAYMDWDNNAQPNEKTAISKIISNTHNGAIILLHPTSEVNANILPIVIEKWKEMGYEFGSLKDI